MTVVFYFLADFGFDSRIKKVKSVASQQKDFININFSAERNST